MSKDTHENNKMIHRRLRKSDVILLLQKQSEYKNIHTIPKLLKICISSGINRDQKEAVVFNKISCITNQLPIYKKTRKSVAAYKIRAGMITGTMVTLRGPNMEEFIHKLCYISLPAITAWKGLKASSIIQTNNSGSISMGIADLDIFLSAKSSDRTTIGCNITFVVQSKTRKETVSLLKAYGLPFQEKNNGK